MASGAMLQVSDPGAQDGIRSSAEQRLRLRCSHSLIILSSTPAASDMQALTSAGLGSGMRLLCQILEYHRSRGTNDELARVQDSARPDCQHYRTGETRPWAGVKRLYSPRPCLNRLYRRHHSGRACVSMVSGSEQHQSSLMAADVSALSERRCAADGPRLQFVNRALAQAAGASLVIHFSPAQAKRLDRRRYLLHLPLIYGQVVRHLSLAFYSKRKSGAWICSHVSEEFRGEADQRSVSKR